jgi:lipid-A-disaccharide synthase
VLYYVGPQVWAWGKGRLDKMGRTVDRVAVVFPFEVPIYENAGVPVTHVGHPLAEELDVDLDAGKLRAIASLPPDEPYLAVLPGSRPPEVRRLLPPMLDALRLLRRRHPRLGAIVAAASDEMAAEARRLGAGPGSGVAVVTGHTHAVLAHARAALVTSGTATLETAALGTPLVIAYKVSWLTWLAARLVVRVRWIGLANILAGEEVAPELIQRDANGEAMAAALEPLIEDGEIRRDTLARLAGLRQKLGSPGAAARVAELALEVIRSSRGRASESPSVRG